MARIKRAIGHLKKRRSLRKKVKGFRGQRKNTIRLSKTASLKAGAHAFKGRKLKKRNYRSLWQMRINAAARELDTTYSKLIAGMKKNKIIIDRKILAKLADEYPTAFAAIVKEAQK